MSEDATEAPVKLLEAEAAKLVKIATALAKHARRKTVKAEDILQAVGKKYDKRVKIKINPFPFFIMSPPVFPIFEDVSKREKLH